MDKDEFDGQVICHCVSNDCSKCPMRNIGTSGIKAERAFLQGTLSETVINIGKQDV